MLHGVNSKLLKQFGLYIGITLSSILTLVFWFGLQVYSVSAATVTATGQIAAVCGNNIVEGAEECDLNAGVNNCSTGHCSASCTCPVCGNSVLESGEECDIGVACSGSATCNNACLCSTGGTCFLAGTPITMADGSHRPIEEITVGDRVASYDADTGHYQTSAVRQLFRHEASSYLLINGILRVTSNHPLYTERGWQEAGDLGVTDVLFGEDGQWQPIWSIIPIIETVPVYNFEVDQTHTYFANDILAHNKGGQVCTPSEVVVTNCGPCVNSQKVCTLDNGCTRTQQTLVCDGTCGDGIQDVGEQCDDGNTSTADTCDTLGQAPRTHGQCTPTYCGDWIVQTSRGEECDDGNSRSGDGCSSSCQIEFGCGNGFVDSGEQCDDNNLVAYDCCSLTCQAELVIKNVVTVTTMTTAVVSWSAPCSLPQQPSFLLEWGSSAVVWFGDGSVNLNSPQYTITGLQPNTTYAFQILGTSGSLQATYAGSFRTKGGVEICANSFDDDGNGLCDAVGATCVDGSQPGDPACACAANFVCTPITSCGVDNTRTMQCTDQLGCQSAYSYQEGCGNGSCSGVSCGACQDLDTNTCACVTRTSCCGNTQCEPVSGETPVSCAQDCPVSCISDWLAGPWQPADCPASGIQTRSVIDQHACQPATSDPLPNQRSCGTSCPGLTCGAGEILDITGCSCVPEHPFCGRWGCEVGETHANCPQDCTVTCQPNWTCQDWGVCANGIQNRTCTDLNNCGIALNKPPETKSCVAGCSVACGTCQQIDAVSCSCLPIAQCCGNRTCESVETVWSCPVDCGITPGGSPALAECLDGRDNDGDTFVDYPSDPGCSSSSDTSERNFTEIIGSVLNNRSVERFNMIVALPFAAVVAASTASAFSLFNLLAYLRYLFTQPIAALWRRRRNKWGVVYNALTRQPVDLAIIRLYEQATSRLMQSRVTDAQGRYNFIVPVGHYYLTVTKPNYIFPTVILRSQKEDVQYLDLYHGEVLDVREDNAVITANIPLDPDEPFAVPSRIIRQYYLRKIQAIIAFSAVPFAAVSVAITPNILTIILLFVHILLYILFRRLGYQKPPKSWGIIYEDGTKKPIGLAIARIYDRQYNKLLESKVTDPKGRYAFLVGSNQYYVTVEKVGFAPRTTPVITIGADKQAAIVDFDISLERTAGGTTEALHAPFIETTPGSSLTQQPAEITGVGRESVTNLTRPPLTPIIPPEVAVPEVHNQPVAPTPVVEQQLPAPEPQKPPQAPTVPPSIFG